MNNRNQFLTLHLSSIALTLVVLVVFDAFDLRLLFFLAFVGYLLSLEVTVPSADSTVWRGRLKIVTALWSLTYVLIVGQYFVDILNGL
jgi:hypothetical protein